MADDAGLVLEGGGDWRKLEQETNRSFSQVLKSMNQLQGQADKLEAHLAGIGKTVNHGHVVNELHSIQDALDKIEPANAEKALAKMFDSSRLAMLEEGGAKLRIFGSALEPLGPIGMAAAAGLVAVGAAAEQAFKFTEKAAEIERTAEALDMTTTQVQELAHVATALNIAPEKLDESVRQLQAHLGELDTNLQRGKQLQTFFAKIGIPSDALRSWGTFDQQLPHILESLSKLSGEARAAFAARMGMDPEVVNTLVEARGRYSDLVAEAHRYGLVIDADVVKRGAEANAKLKTAGEIISNNLTVAFADLAPVIVSVAGVLADATRNLNEFIQSFKKLEDHNEGALRMEQADLIAEDAHIRRTFPGIKPAPQAGQTQQFSKGGLDSLFMNPNDRLTAVQNDLSDVDLALINQARADAPVDKGVTPVVPKTGHPHPDHSATEISEAEVRYLEALERGAKDLDEAHRTRLLLIKAQYTVALARAAQEKKPATRQKLIDTAGLTRDADIDAENERYAKAQRDHTRGFTDELARLQEAQLSAHADITGSLADRQAAERARLKDEQEKAAEDLGDKVAGKDYQTDAGRVEAARLISAQAAEFLAQTEQQQAQQAKETADEETKAALRGLDFDHQRLEALQKLAKTQDERRSLAEQLLANEKRQAELKLDQQGRNERWSPEQMASARSALGLDFQARQAGVAAQYAGAFGKFAAENGPGNLGPQLEDNAVKAMETLNSGLADAIVQGKGLKDVLKKALQQFLSGEIQSGLKSGEGGLLSLFSKGAGAAAGATGGDPTSGGSPSQAGGFGAFKSTLGIVGGLFHLFGFAGGTSPGGAPGGLAIVGERGPELANLPRGTSITPNSGLVSALSRLPGLRSGGAGQITLHVQSSYDMTGVQGDRSIDAKIEASHNQTVSEMVDAMRSLVPGMMAEHQMQAG